MEAGPFRGSRPNERRAVAPAQRQSETPKQPVVKDDAKTPSHPRTTRPQPATQEQGFLKRFKWLFLAVLLVAALVFGWFAYSHMKGAMSAVDSGKYQAVFFANGQVYFGKLQMLDKQNMKLTKVYYLKSPTDSADGASNPQATNSSSEDDNNVQLIKLGNEIHGPEDSMIINRDQVLFFENLKNDSEVSKLMKDYEAKK